MNSPNFGTNHKPLILLAVANEQRSTGAYLRALPKEYREILEALKPALDAGLCQLEHRTNVTYEGLLDLLQDPVIRKNLSIFHFAGHADIGELFLESAEGATAAMGQAAFVALMERLPSLKLVFLNACFTKSLALNLKAGGVPLVVGTTQTVNDEQARLLAVRFYKGLAAGLSIQSAWIDALNQVENNGKKEQRGGRISIPVDSALPPWVMDIRPGSENEKEWNLPEASRNPLFGIPDLPEIPYPENPYPFLAPYRRSEARVFFGRGSAIKKLYLSLTEPGYARVILLHGQSGVGKSSLLDAGLIPRLEKDFLTVYKRRDRTASLSAALAQSLGIEALEELSVEERGRALKKRWISKEKELQEKGKNGLIVILDQAEEAFSQGKGKGSEETMALIELLNEIFSIHPVPVGKLLLSYRKEFHPELVSLFQKKQLDFFPVFIQRLDGAEIEEIIRGPMSNEALRAHYQLKIEPELPAVVAQFLTLDQESAVAPVLQIILARLWKEQADKEQKEFTLNAFYRLREQGVLLHEFFDQQMKEIREWENHIHREVEESGLVLDMLHFHTSDAAAGYVRNLEELREKYEHQRDVLEQLIQEFKNLYLLTDAGSEKSTLAHDTLGPVILKAFQQSNRPGQQAYRLLTVKLDQYSRHPENTFLDEEELAIVDQGKTGMRLLVPQADELIAKSRRRKEELESERREAQRQKLRNRQLRRFTLFFFLIGLLAGGLASWQGWLNRQTARVNNKVAEARSFAGIDPVKALNLVREALSIGVERELAIQARHDIVAENEFYQHIIRLDQEPLAMCFSEKNGRLAVGTTDRFLLFDQSGKNLLSIATPAQPLALFFTGQDQQVLAVFSDQTLCYLKQGEGTFQRLDSLANPVRGVAFHEKTGRLAIVDWNGKVQIWLNNGNRRSGAFSLSISEDKKANPFLPIVQADAVIAFSSSGDTLAVGGFDQQIYLHNWAGKLLRVINWHKDLVLSLAFTTDGRLLSCGRDKMAYFWGASQVPLSSFPGHNLRINKGLISSNGALIVTAGDDGSLRAWNTETGLGRVYRGHYGFVHNVVWSEEQESFISLGTDSTLRQWVVESKIARRYGPFSHGVIGLDIDETGKILLAGSSSGEADNYERLNDLDFFWQQDTTPQPCFRWMETFSSPESVFPTELRGIQAILHFPGCIVVGGEGEYCTFFPEGKSAFKKAIKGRATLELIKLDANRFALATEEEISFWTKDGQETERFANPLGPALTAMAWNPAKEELFIGGLRADTVSVYMLKKSGWKPLFSREVGATALTCSPDGKTLVLGWEDGLVQCYQLPAYAIKRSFRIPVSTRTGLDACISLAYSPDGRKLAIGTRGGRIKVLDNRYFSEEWTFSEASGYAVYRLRFSSGARALFAGSGDGWVRKYLLE